MIIKEMTFHDDHLEKLDAEMASRLMEDLKSKIRIYMGATEGEKIKLLKAKIEKLERQIQDLKSPQTERLFPEDE